jgi:hypothetical protein
MFVKRHQAKVSAAIKIIFDEIVLPAIIVGVFAYVMVWLLFH